jgi:ankyrin repeat protein
VTNTCKVFNNPDEDMAEYAKEILRCMIVVFQPPTIQELAVLADLPKSCHGDIPKLEKYIRLCGSFIDIVEAPDSTQTVSFIHQSAKDFLQASSTDLFAEQSEAIQHGIVALRCVEHITGQQVTILGDLKDEHESSDEESSNSAAEETENDDLEGSEAEDDECLPEILEVLDNKHAQVTHEVIPEESMEEIGGLVKDLKSVVQGVEEPTIYRPASLAHIDPYFQPPAVLNMESSLSYTQIPDREFLAGMSNIDESQATNNSSFDQKPYGARSQPQWLNQQFTIPPSPITESERSFSFTPTPVDLHMDVARTSSQNSIRVDPFIEDRVSPLSEPQTCDTSSSSSNAAIPLQHSLSRLSRSGAVKRRSILFNEADELTQNPSISDRRRSSLGIRRFSRQQERQVSGDPVEYVSSETGSIGKNEGHLEFGSQSPTFPQDQPRTPSHAAELADTSFTPQHQQYQEHINSPKPIVKRKPLPARIPVSPNNRPPLQVNMPSYGPSDLHLRGGGGGPMSDDGHEDNDNLSEYDYDHETLLYPVLYWMRHAMAATSDLVEIFDLADQFWSEKSDARSKWWESFVDASRSGSTVSGLSDFSPLHVACYLGYTDLVKRLVKEGGVASLSVPDSWGHCPLYWAAFRDNVNSAIILLEAGADVNATQRGKKDGIAALYGAADAGNLEMVRCLLKNGSTVDVENEDYGTALYIASENGHLDVVQELLSCNAKINSAGGYYKRPITGAAYYEQDEIVQELLKHKPEIIPDDESRYGNALQTAAHEGVELIVQMLLDYGVNIDIKGGHYDYAIAAAASEKKDDIVGLLLTRNPCVESLNEAIFRAAQVGDEDVVRLVLEEFDKRELSPSFTSRRGNSLVSPAQNGYVEVLNMLLEKSPGMALINEALYEASVRIEFGAVEALLNAGADPNSEGICFYLSACNT